MTSLAPDRYAEFVLRYRLPVIALAVAVMLGLTAGARFVTVTNDERDLFDESNPQLEAIDVLEHTYSPFHSAVIAVAPQEGSVFTRETLGAIEELTEAAWGAPRSTRVDSLTNYSYSEAFEDDLSVGPLVDGAESLSDDDLARIHRIALNEISVAGRLVSHDGRVAGLMIGFALPESADAAVIEITDWLYDLLDEARAAHPDIAYHLTGDVVMNRTLADATQDDLRALAPIALVVILAATALLLCSLFGTLSLVVVLMFAVGSTVGLAGWTGTVFNPISASVPLIVMTIAVAHSIHIVEAVLSGMGRGLGRNAAIVESLRDNAWPVFLTSATTMIGFLSLNASDSPPFRILGNLVAFGVLCAFVYTMTILPSLLSVLPLQVRPPVQDGPHFSVASASSSPRATQSCSGLPPPWLQSWWSEFPASS